jgi:peptidoglycan/xylan/chitin deacetylase (PgdA/CDA1 family)
MTQSPAPRLDCPPVTASPLRTRSRRATFLCYHSIAAEGPTYLTVSPELFERQLCELGRLGVATGALAELTALAAGRDGPPTAFLTFDDGFLDNFTTVLPLLREHRARGFVFVLPPLLGEGGVFAWPEVAADRERFPATMRSVNWDQLGEMAEGGFEVGSHTLSHRHLPELDGEELRQELADSRARIRERLGHCDTLAYPFGEWSPEVTAAAAECGYSYAFTLPTAIGQRRAGAHSIPRINVDYRDDEGRLRRKLGPVGKEVFLSPRVAAVRRLVRRLRGKPAPGSV